MLVSSVSLKNVRNLKELNIGLSEGINILYGNNAQGKTNFLEAIYICATGRSHRTASDKEIINFKENEAFINLSSVSNGIKDKISVYLRRDLKKGIAVNGVALRKLGDLFGRLLIVMFSPEDLQLVKSGPSERRKFMDMEICQLSNVYYYELQSYYKALRQRNNLLKEISRDKSLKDTIFIWDEQIISHGIKIYNHRMEFTSDINKISSGIYSDITEAKEKLEILYKPNITPETFKQRLERSLEKDIYGGSTSYGIHKDDISFLIDGTEARNFGSQGQQRSVSLCAKLAEIELIKNKTGITPVLLLDDVLSELDSGRQFFLLSRLSDIQTLITCTGVEDVLSKVSSIENIKIFNVENGMIAEKRK
jgi:DNA replication and repair protein RecF